MICLWFCPVKDITSIIRGVIPRISGSLKRQQIKPKELASVQYHHVMAPKLNLNPVAIYKSSSQGKLQMCVEAACTKKLWQQREAVSFL